MKSYTKCKQLNQKLKETKKHVKVETKLSNDNLDKAVTYILQYFFFPPFKKTIFFSVECMCTENHINLFRDGPPFKKLDRVEINTPMKSLI